ncbi:MAG: Maf family protein [Hyphomicrobiales bacterium]|nr:Maf family protein [Hyphomicrobiales bacterium]
MRKGGAGVAWAGEARLILASRSATRRHLLARCGIDAEPIAAAVDERSIEAEEMRRGALPSVVARCLASQKALVVSRRTPGRLVLGADQVLAHQDRCFAKPATLDEAASRLAELAGKHHRLISACALARDGVLVFEAAETAELKMRELSQTEINAYLQTVGEQVLASVGAYQVEGLGRLLFERIEGDHAVILGLPLTSLLAYLHSAGLIGFRARQR